MVLHLWILHSLLCFLPIPRYFLPPSIFIYSLMCRYELHEWLFTLHNSMENFKKRLQRMKERQQLEQNMEEQGVERGLEQHPSRPHTAESQRTNLSSSITISPSRRAPLPPQERLQWRPDRENGAVENASPNGLINGSPRRKPVRPAPVLPASIPPRGRTHSTSSGGPGLSGFYNDVALPPASFEYGMTTPTSISQTASYPPVGTGTFMPYGTESYRGGYNMESGQYVNTDPNITEMQSNQETSDAWSPRFHESSSLVLMQKVSNSLPEMLDDVEDSISPETLEEEEEQTRKTTKGSVSPSTGCHHTRHLSLMVGSKKDVTGVRHSGRRKLRSRSPPNLPPPPPPPSDSIERLLETSQDHDFQRSVGKGASYTSSVSTTSPGYSKVFHTISDIDKQLDNITENFTTSTVIKVSQPPKHPPPLPPTEEDTVDGFCVEDWMCDLPPSPTDQLGSSSHKNILPDQEVPLSPPHTDVLFDLTNGMAEEKPAETQHHVMFKEDVEAIPHYEPCVDHGDNGEAEEPGSVACVDHGDNGEAEEPGSVAAIKMRLFGKREAEATRYKKDGVLSPRNTHPASMTFSNDYFNNTNTVGGNNHTSYDHSESIITHDNVNNNNSERESIVVSELIASSVTAGKDDSGNKGTGNGTTPVPSEGVVGEAGTRPHYPKHNVYESPWDEKPISKFKEMGIVRKTMAHPKAQESTKEKTPPLVPPKQKQRNSIVQHIKFAEVYEKETPRPFATEVRNVLSLERRKKEAEVLVLSPTTSTQPSPPSPDTHHSSPDDGDSLLASISNILQATSRYGSVSLLNKEEASPSFPGNACEKTPPSTATLEPRITPRRELEKIRLAYHKDPFTSNLNTSVSSPYTQTNKTDQQSTSLVDSAPSSANSSPYNSRAAATGRAQQQHRVLTPSKKPDTQVTYDAKTQGHILRSLV